MSYYEYRLRRPVYKNVGTSTLLALLCGEDSNDETMEYKFGVPVACVAVFAFIFLRRHRRLSVIRDVPGPTNPSWFFGVFQEGQPGPLLPPIGLRR